MTESRLTSPAVLKKLLREHAFRHKKRLGQNFLVDDNILQKIVSAADVGPEDEILEIGAGAGVLTRALASLAGRVVAVEVDRTLEGVLRTSLEDYANVNLVFADVLETDLEALFETAGPRKAVANLPYYITTPVLMRLLESDLNLTHVVVMVQKEVAERMVARPGTKDYGALSIAVQYRGEARLASLVPRTVFIPKPNVDSAIVCIRLTGPTVEVVDETAFFRVVHGAFGQRRKMLRNTLAHVIGDTDDELGSDGVDSKAVAEDVLIRAGIDGQRRGETLSLEEFAAVTNALVHHRT